MESFNLAKRIWTVDDFEEMNWHDCKIHAISFGDNHSFLLDIDYIFKWVDSDENWFSYWVSPSTMVFENVYDLSSEFDAISEMEINVIKRDDEKKPPNGNYINKEKEWEWIIETTNSGVISFRSVGYIQYIRKMPIYQRSQCLELDIRGGYSFDRITC